MTKYVWNCDQSKRYITMLCHCVKVLIRRKLPNRFITLYSEPCEYRIFLNTKTFSKLISTETVQNTHKLPVGITKEPV
jgi:hypothetical protein